MSSHNEQIKPTEFAVTASSPLVPPSSPADNPPPLPRWVSPLLLVLVVTVVFVVFWLPDRINQQAVPQLSDNDLVSSEAVTSAKLPTSAKNENIGAEKSPWSDAQMAKLRKQAQETLNLLLDTQSELEEIGVQQWAAEDFANANSTAAAGDALYRERNFIEARANYQHGLAELQALLEKAPQVLAKSLLHARESIDAGNAQAADSALHIAAAIEPDNVELTALKQRAAVLQALMSLLEEAEAAEASGDLALAQKLLRQATELDSKSATARSELMRVAKAFTTQRFNQAMSDGYAALEKGQFEQARSAIKKAGRLVSGSAVAASALKDVDVAETAQRLADLQQQSQAYEKNEQWSAAVTAFKQALQIDTSLLFAQQGLKRSGVRLKLDEQLRSVIEQPDRLADKKVADATAQLLRNAAEISPRGPLLQQQLQQLEALLEKANTLVPVILQSDMATEVTLRKVARLGRFQQRQLSLRPGTYIAVGTRDGYRDVRRTFSVKHNSKPPTVVIACTEQI